HAVDDWFGALHRVSPPPEASFYRRLAIDEPDPVHYQPSYDVGETVSPSMTADSAGTVNDFKVADLSLAAFGRKEIQLAEHEMPGLMALRREFGPSQPLAGKKIAGSLHMTI